MVKYFYLLLIILSISCKTTTEPVIYDKNIDKADKEADLIHILINNGNFEEAEKQLDKNLILFPDNPELLLLKGWLFLELNKFEESEKIFTLLIQKNKNNSLALTGLAVINRIKGNKDLSLKYITDALRYLPTNSNLWLEKGILEYDKKNYNKAIQYFNRAYNSDNKNIDAYFYKYITSLQLGEKEIDEIYYMWENLLEKKEYKSWYFQYHAQIIYEKQKKSLAYQIIKEGLEYFPNDLYLLNMHSYHLYNEFLLNNKKESLDEAMQNILICIENSENVKPEFADTYFLLLEASGDKEKLKNEIEKYALFFPDNQIIIKWIKKINIIK